jgi:hypothetical protein
MSSAKSASLARAADDPAGAPAETRAKTTARPPGAGYGVTAWLLSRRIELREDGFQSADTRRQREAVGGDPLAYQLGDDRPVGFPCWDGSGTRGYCFNVFNC